MRDSQRMLSCGRWRIANVGAQRAQFASVRMIAHGRRVALRQRSSRLLGSEAILGQARLRVMWVAIKVVTVGLRRHLLAPPSTASRAMLTTAVEIRVVTSTPGTPRLMSRIMG